MLKAKKNLLNNPPPLLSVRGDTSIKLASRGGELLNKHALYPFFKHFPKAMICVAGWDLGSNVAPVRRFWYDFTVKELKELNLKKYKAIFFTPCNVKEPDHHADNFAGINAWYVDIDLSAKDEEVTAEEMEERKSKKLGEILMLGTGYLPREKELLQPSFVVETRNGFHIYWLAWEGDNSYKPSLDLFDYIEKNIAERIGGDFKAKKAVQLMRLPGFYNWKNGVKNPSPCRILPQFNFSERGIFRKYCEDEWLDLFGEPEADPGIQKTYSDLKPSIISFMQRNKKRFDIFEHVAGMPQDRAMEMLSGKSCVNGEVYTFRPVGGGKKLNIYINGKLCSSFIDLEKNLLLTPSGAGRGSPNVIEWIKWYRPEWIDEPSLLATELKKIYGK